MQTHDNTPLSTLTTMRLGGPAQHVVTVTTRDELASLMRDIGDAPYFVLGEGSNVIARDAGFAGTIILNRILDFEVLSHEEIHTIIRIGAGENWDDIVARTVEMGLSGIEAMSAIPGTAGATPVQNVGAYGQEIADTLVELEAYDTTTGTFVTLSRDDCHFSYRNSIFKNPAHRHHVINSITLRLSKQPMESPLYASLQHYLDEQGIVDHSPRIIRDAVIAIRARKLPDPRIIANTGSFFKNPIVDSTQAETLQSQFSDIPQYYMSDGRIKLAAGWLIEQTGLKGFQDHGFKTYEGNALVVVNESASTYAALQAFKTEIVEKVHEKFGVTLEQEPETL